MDKWRNLLLLFCLILFGCGSDEESNETAITQNEQKEEIREIDTLKEIQSEDRYVKSNENLIFSFETAKDKRLAIVVDTSAAYIKYRFGEKDKIELEYPATNEDTWSKFEAFLYLRGGGVENEGLEDFQLTFENNDVVYTVYENYYSVTEERTIGVKVSVGEKEVDIEGLDSTQIGSLYHLRDYEQLEQGW